MNLAYCTNIHAGADLPTLIAKLEDLWPRVRRSLPANRPLGLGMWFSAKAARQFLSHPSLPGLKDWLRTHDLTVTTLNGFPYGDFHADRVKHRVYHPNWFESLRCEYTRDLIALLCQLIPAGSTASISTLPIAWADPNPARGQLQQAAANLRDLAHHLHELADSHGTTIQLCLEPEPGCYLQRSADVVRFMNEYLLGRTDDGILRAHLAVCHDICHAAVLFESQQEALATYRDAGIPLGKVQVSSALHVDFERADSHDARQALRRQLAEFAEDRYLHQTSIWTKAGLEFHDDLEVALRSHPEPRGQWRVHFHVPIHLAAIGSLGTTQGDIQELVSILAGQPGGLSGTFEVETYAWDVLPRQRKPTTIEAGIAAELSWFHSLAQALSVPRADQTC